MAAAVNASTLPFCTHNGTAHDGTFVCHWMNNPVTRGTLNILWLCISTLGVCVWSAVHPGIPYPGSSWLRRLRIRVAWLLVGLFMPEMLVLCALSQLREAMSLLMVVEMAGVRCEIPWWMPFLKSWELQNVNTTIKKPFWMQALPPCLHPRALTGRVPSGQFNATRSRTKIPWKKRPFEPWMSRNSNAGLEQNFAMNSLQHLPSSTAPADEQLPYSSAQTSVDLNPELGSDGPEQDDPSQPIPVDQTSPAQYREHPWTLTHCFHAVMGGYFAGTGGYYAGCSMGDREHRAHDRDGARREIVQWVKNPPLNRDSMSIPDVSAEDIGDRSKANSLSKSLLIWQLFVFLANCAARWNQGLPLSLLEITTISHSLCSLIALVLWWYKSHSVGQVTMVGRATALGPPPALTVLQGLDIVLPGHDSVDVLRTVAIFAITALYGLPHLLGLLVHFPSSAEKLLWKISTYAVIVLPLIICLIMWIVWIGMGSKGADGIPWVVRMMTDSIFHLCLIMYTVCSMFLVGESFRQVFALPEGSFHEPELARYLPSFS